MTTEQKHITEESVSEHFSWIPFYMEMADKLLQFKPDRKDLIEIVYSLDEEHVNYIKDNEGGRYSDIDPFSVFAIFNRGLSHQKRIAVATHFKNKLGIDAPIPADFDGIPVMNNQQSVFVWRGNIATDVQPLWDFFEYVITHNAEKLKEAFDVVVKQKGIKWNITMGLFWIRPYDYIALDSRNRDYIPSLGINVFKENQIDAAHYIHLLESVKEKIASSSIKEKDIPEISYQAWASDSSSSDSTESQSGKSYWLLGHAYSSTDPQFDRFVHDGIWEGRFDENKPIDQRQLNLIKKVKVGDVIMLKSTAVKQRSIPFLRIKAVGIVTDPIEEFKGTEYKTCMCSIKYICIEDKDFDGASYGAYRQTVHVADEKAKEVIDYANSIINNKKMSRIKHQKYIDLLKEAKNLVLTGAPGTGKTFMAQSIAEEMGAEVKFVQFHPSYDYTDFVEGLRPVDNGNGQIGFERKDGVFKEFCKVAIKNIADSEKSVEKKPFILIIDEINRGEASKIFGELFYAIDPGYRGKTNVLVQTQYQNLVPESDIFAKGFYVPENVYILATMNDIDRSVESMDFAMRRRFTWQEITPEDTQEMLDSLGCAAKAKATMERLNKVIADTDGLGAAYMIGPSYFLKLKENGENFDKLWTMNIEPLLKEYLRGFRDAKKTLKGFEAAYKENGTTDASKSEDDDDNAD